ncbi:hypothetical protein G9A89_009417 [Geosiphon pyriformis]|nr:hypothetical protein G9A89_009417 [Geosiphon pyriformis]
MFGPDWIEFYKSLGFADIIAGIPAMLVIYTVIPSVVYTVRQRSNKGNWYVPPEARDESLPMHAKLLILRSLAFMFTIKYIAQYIFRHPSSEVFVSGALLTVALITVTIYHYENLGIIKPALPLSVLWGVTTLTTMLYYFTSTHDVSHEIYIVSSIMMFILEFLSPRTEQPHVKTLRPSLPNAHKPLSGIDMPSVDNKKEE